MGRDVAPAMQTPEPLRTTSVLNIRDSITNRPHELISVPDRHLAHPLVA